KSKLIVLDAKDAFSKQRLFQQAWSELYPGLLEWVPLSKGGSVTSVDAATRTLVTDFGRHQAKVANVIPPQKAGRIADVAGVTDRSGWCPIDPTTFESKLQPGVHVIGDAAIAGAMPKSAFAANSQAKTCAAAIARVVGRDRRGLFHGRYGVRRRCHTEIAHRRQRRSGAWPRDRGQPPGRPVPALSQRTVPGGAVPGQSRARSRRSRQARVRGPAAPP